MQLQSMMIWTLPLDQVLETLSKFHWEWNDTYFKGNERIYEHYLLYSRKHDEDNYNVSKGTCLWQF